MFKITIIVINLSKPPLQPKLTSFKYKFGFMRVKLFIDNYYF